MRLTYDREIKALKKGDIFTETEKDYYDNREYKLTLRVDRVNKLTVSVTCIDGYMKNSAWKIYK